MSADFSFPVTFFPDYGAARKWERSCTIYDLADRARETTAAAKAALPWWKLARFGDRRTAKNSLRSDDNVLAITGIEADYDGGVMPFDDAVEILEKLGLLALIYTSPSHTEDAPRWRVLCPLSVEMLPEKRQHMLGRLNGAFRGIFSRESWTLSQSYYYGSVNRNPSHHVEALLGNTIDQLDDLDGELWTGPPGTGSNNGGSGIVSAEMREDAELIRCALTGEHLHVETTALAARYIGRGIPADTVAGILRGIMLSHPERNRDERWQARYADIDNLVGSAVAKYSGEQIERRRAIARLAWRMVNAKVSGREIEAAVTAEADRVRLPTEHARRIAASILQDAMKEAAHG